MEQLLRDHLVELYVFYGLAFFCLALVSYLKPRADDSLRLGPQLWLLALFGLLHGLREYADLWILLHGDKGVSWLAALLLAFSYVALFEFGRRVALQIAGPPGLCRVLSPLAYLPVAAGLTLIVATAEELLPGLESGSRFAIGLPGSLLAGIALLVHLRAERRQLAGARVDKQLRIVALGFMAYGLLTVLGVSSAPGLPGWLDTTAVWASLSDYPVQFWRMLTAFVLAFSMSEIMRRLARDAVRREQVAQEQLRLLNKELDERVAQRTAEIEALNAELQKEMVERGAALQQLRSSEERFRNMAANIPGAIFQYVLHADGSDRVSYMSPGCLSIWEVDSALVERDASILWAMVHPEDLPAMQQSVMESARSQKPWQHVWRIKTPSGCGKWLHGFGRPRQGERGDIVWDSLILDVTDRVQAERAARESEARFRQLFEEVPAVAVQGYAMDGTTRYWNEASERLYGYSASEAIGRNVIELIIPPKDRDVMQQAMLEMAASGRAITPGEMRLMHKEGATVPVLASHVVLDSVQHGRELYRLDVDLSEREQSRLELERLLAELKASSERQAELLTLARREQGRMAALLSAMNMGILFEDRQGNVEYINPAFRNIWAIDEGASLIGRPTQNVLEHSNRRFARPDHASGFVLQAMDALETSERFEVDLCDGRILTQFSCPVDDMDGKIIGRLWIYEDITHERQTAQQLIYLAEHDPLTGLYNRRRFEEHIEITVETANRRGSRFALLYFDLDEFKYINDTFGHRAGDMVLLRIAGELNDKVRASEFLARIGGDEFAVVCEDAGGEEATALAKRIVQSVSAIPFDLRGTNLRLTVSIGICVYPEHGETTEDLVAHADAAMYQAKQLGKNTWAVYDPKRDTSEQMMHRLTWTRRIALALEEDAFELHFQGIYSCTERRLSHVEALVRMRDLTTAGEVVGPGVFIPIAEKSGQIVAIDRWVLERGIMTLAQHPNIPALSVNISARSFDQPSLPNVLRDLLAKHSVAPKRLMVELTETEAVAEIEDAQRFIEALHRLGCIVCLDDFGSGFSTFVYLKQLGVEVLKIDGMFIRDLPNNRDNQAFVKAMVDVARGLGKRTIAEFVEDEATLEMLARIGVDMAQGFLLDRPVKEHVVLQSRPTCYRGMRRIRVKS